MSNGKDHPGTWRTVNVETTDAETLNAWLEKATDDGFDYDSLKMNERFATIYKVNKAGH
jgi:hypothetical protein